MEVGTHGYYYNIRKCKPLLLTDYYSYLYEHSLRTLIFGNYENGHFLDVDMLAAFCDLMVWLAIMLVFKQGHNEGVRFELGQGIAL